MRPETDGVDDARVEAAAEAESNESNGRLSFEAIDVGDLTWECHRSMQMGGFRARSVGHEGGVLRARGRGT